MKILVAVAFLLAAAGLFAAVLAFFGADEPLRACCAYGPTKPEYEHGKRATYELDVENEGRFSVTIVDVPVPRPEDFTHMFEIRGVELIDEGVPFETRPFEPFELEPGEMRRMRLVGVFANCGDYVANGSVSMFGKVVRYRVFGIEREQLVEFVEPLEVTAPADEDCPEPRP